MEYQRSSTAPAPAIQTPGFLQAVLPSTVAKITAPYRVSSMKVIGIRCWPTSRCTLPGCPPEGGRNGAEQSRDRPLTLQRPIASEASNGNSPRPLSQREHPHAGTDGRVSPSLISLKYCYVPLSGRGPPIAHDVRLETRALFAFTIDTYIYIYRRNRAAPQVCQRLKRWLRPYPPRYRSSIPRSGPRCAAQVHGVAPWSTRRRTLR